MFPTRISLLLLLHCFNRRKTRPLVMTVTPAPAYDDDMPTNREMYRTLCDFREEWRIQMTAFVRRDVYAAEQEAIVRRVTIVEQTMAADKAEQAKDRAALKTQFNGMWFSIAAAVAAAAFIAAWIK